MKKSLLFWCWLIPAMLSAQDSIRGSAYIQGDELYLGKVFFLELEVSAPKSVQVFLPDRQPEIAGVEKYGIPSKTQFTEHESIIIHQKRYPYIAFDSLSGTAGPFEITYTDHQENKKTLILDPIPFKIQRIQADTTDSLRAAYGPINQEERNAMNAFFTILAVLIVLILMVLFIKWRKTKSQLSIPENIDPTEWALGQLETVKAEIPFARHKESWTHLSEILRLFLEKSWGLPAPYFSTGELLEAIAKKNEYSSQLERVSELLSFCDGVKFAKKISTEEEQISALTQARKIILFTPGPEGEN